MIPDGRPGGGPVLFPPGRVWGRPFSFDGVGPGWLHSRVNRPEKEDAMTRYLACCLLCLVPSLASGAGDAFKKGVEALGKKEYDKAIKDFTDAIRLDPKNAAAYRYRGHAHFKKKEYDRAIKDFTDAIRLGPKFITAYFGRGLAYYFKKEYDKAIRDYTQAIRLDPKDAPAYTNLAWLLATCPKEEVRNGKKAVEYAKKACELTGWKEPNKLSVLAAAHAEAGQFKEAVKWEKKALEIGWDDKVQQEGARKRLKLYEAGKPYRDE
jgi:tetratricopeptide (TPR) repeat protein